LSGLSSIKRRNISSEYVSLMFRRTASKLTILRFLALRYRLGLLLLSK
jgi:hypothetical protein